MPDDPKLPRMYLEAIELITLGLDPKGGVIGPRIAEMDHDEARDQLFALTGMAVVLLGAAATATSRDQRELLQEIALTFALNSED